MIVDAPTPCHGKSELFDSTFHADHTKAAALCQTCPALEACRIELKASRDAAHHGFGPEGTWAGELVGAKPPRTIATPAEVEQQEADYTPDDVRKAHNQYQKGLRTEWALTGHRIYERQRARRRKAARANAA